MGSIAEAAADTIGARGLLCRVGAYFHDIGKMLKPGYFIENQGPDEDNRHESLVPAMSTLVIIAHIKDGSDLARQHHLPQPIIDMIAQHHGTTLVDTFSTAHSNNPTPTTAKWTKAVSAIQAPNPKPRKRRCSCWPAPWKAPAARWSIRPRRHRKPGPRTGRTPPGRRAVRRKRTDASRTSGHRGSLVMSLTSIYHGRIKYPEQKTA